MVVDKKKQDRDFMKIDYKIYFPLIMMGIKAIGFWDTYVFPWSRSSHKKSIKILVWIRNINHNLWFL
jgi:hypothetical protein